MWKSRRSWLSLLIAGAPVPIPTIVHCSGSHALPGTSCSSVCEILELLLDFVFIHKRKLCAVLTELGHLAFPFGPPTPGRKPCSLSPSASLNAEARTIRVSPWNTNEPLIGPTLQVAFSPFSFNPFIMLYFLHRTEIIWNYWFMWSVLWWLWKVCNY